MKKIRFYSQSLWNISEVAYRNTKVYLTSLGYNVIELSYNGFMDCFLGVVEKEIDTKPDFIEYI